MSAVAGRGCQERRGHLASSAPCLTPSGGADRRAGPGLWGASRGQPVPGPLWAPLPLRVGPRSGGGLGAGVSAAARQELAGRLGRGTGDERQVGPSLGLGTARGGGGGRARCARGARWKLSRRACWAVGRNSARGTRRPAFARASESGGFYRKTGGSLAGPRKEEGPRGPSWGDPDLNTSACG